MTEDLGEAERLAVAYAPSALRSRYRALLALDAMLRRISLRAREPLPAQLKLAWWRDACERLPEGREHPVLAELAACWNGGPGALVGLVDAWEEVVVSDDFATGAETVAKRRAGALAACAAMREETARPSARVWTLVTLSDHALDPEQRNRMRAFARQVPEHRLPRSLRPLAVLGGLARRALAAERATLVGDRWSPLVAMRLGIFGR